MNLYQINDILQHAVDYADPETGEIPDLDSLKITRADMIEGLALSVKNDLAMIEAIDKEIERLLKKKKTLANGVEWRKRYLGNALTLVRDGEVIRDKFTSGRVQIGWRKSSSVVFDNNDEKKFCEDHPNYCVIKTEVKPDKRLIKADIDKGVTITGAAVVEKNSLQIK